MISHLNVGTNDFARAFAFYEAVFGALGLVLRFRGEEGHWAAWVVRGTERPLFVVNEPFDGNPASVGNGQMIALNAPDRDTVDRCHATAMQVGGSDEGAPGPRPEYHASYYGAYFRDPDGNKLCVVCHAPEIEGSLS